MAERRLNRNFEEVKPEMTPMIDVTFLLLIFFIVTLKFKTLEGRLDANLPKDRGINQSQAEEIEKVDIVLRVANPGRLELDPDTSTKTHPQGRLEHYVGRRIRYTIGANSWTDLDKVDEFLEDFDKEETPVTIDARTGTIYKDVVKVLDVVIAHGFKQVAFGGSHEEE